MKSIPKNPKSDPFTSKNDPLKKGTAAPSIISLWSKIDADSPEKDVSQVINSKESDFHGPEAPPSPTTLER